jgi:hypothetical protein
VLSLSVSLSLSSINLISFFLFPSFLPSFLPSFFLSFFSFFFSFLFLFSFLFFLISFLSFFLLLLLQVADRAGNRADQKTREIVMIDRAGPILSLNGPEEMKVEGGTKYSEQYAIAIDQVIPAITKFSLISLSINRSLHPSNNRSIN